MLSKAIKLEEDMYNRIKNLGDIQQRSPHWLMKEAIRQFLEREERTEAIRRDTLERLAQLEATGEVIPFESVDGWLATWGTESEAGCPVSYR